MRRTASTLVLCLSLTVLASCGGSSNDAKSTAVCVTKYWNGTMGTCLPNGWHVVDPSLLEERGLPAEVTAAFQADSEVSGSFPTVTVTRQVLRAATTPEAFGADSVTAVSALPEYKKLDQRTVTIDGHQVPLHVYSAKIRSDRPAQRYYQLSTTAGRSGFTVTAALPLSVDTTLEQRVLLILENSTFQEPQPQAAATEE